MAKMDVRVGSCDCGDDGSTKKGAGASIQPVQALLLASLPQNSVDRQASSWTPSRSNLACDNPKMEFRHLLAACMPLIN
jgi:hypothetical protein